MTKSYLISGANRGIGLGLAEAFLSQGHTVYAGARDPSKAEKLNELAATSNGRLVIVKLDSGSVQDVQNAAKVIEKKTGSLDVVIANAGISDYYGPLATAPLDQFTRHYEVNVLGPVILFQGLRQVLLKSSDPKFVAISSAAGSIGQVLPLQDTPYSSSKAALNLVIQKMAREDPSLTAISMSPGWVQTEMGNFGATSNGLKEAPVKLPDSLNGIVKVIEAATRETHVGRFWNYDGEQCVW